MSDHKWRDDLSVQGIVLTVRQEEQFAVYAKMLAEWNEKMNLTAIVDTQEIYSKHFYDSMLPFIKNGCTSGSICDVGAGAGFPSIPAKILYPDLCVTIVEPLQKRCIFLRALAESLELQNVTIMHARAEEFALTHRESFDIVCARAVANLRILAELCMPLIRVNGLFLAMKGSSGLEEAEEAKQAAQKLGCALRAYDRELVGDHTHINLYYHKEKETPKKYPRLFAKIKKDPL